MLDSYVTLIREGGVVAFPTETVYGLGADAWNPSAIAKVFETKGRPTDNPLIVHVASREMVDSFAAEVPEEAETLMRQFWPGPLTLIFRKKPGVLDGITAGLPTVALRWPAHPLAQELIARTGPLVAPSANSSGKPSPTRPAHVREDFGDDFPVVEGGETEIGLESTVLDLSQKPYRIYRPGAVGAEEIEKLVRVPVEAGPSAGEPDAPARSPGTKYTHYAPSARVRWLAEAEAPERPSTLYLFHTGDPGVEGPDIIAYRGDYRRMARELFDRFRQADHLGYREVAVEPFTDAALSAHPVASAMKNRITKAAGGRSPAS